MEHSVPQLVELCAVDLCMSHMDGSQQTPAVSALLSSRRGLRHLSHYSAVRLWLQPQQQGAADSGEWLSS